MPRIRTRRWESVSGVSEAGPKYCSTERGGIKRVSGRTGAILRFDRRDLSHSSESLALIFFCVHLGIRTSADR